MNIETFKRLLYITPKLPRQVNIEPTTVCNLDCKVCKRKSLGLVDEYLSIDKFNKIIEKLCGVKEISFGGYGEPFMNEKIFDMVDIAKDKGFEVTTTSNGYLINEGMFERLIKFNALRISIESISPESQGGHPYNIRLKKTLEDLIKFKNKVNSNFKLIYNTIVHKNNYNQIVDIVKQAESIGADGIELIHLDTKDNNIYGTVNKADEIALYKKIKKMDLNINLSTFYDGFEGLRKLSFRMHTKCPMAYELMHIRMNGDVTPCCFGLPLYKIDNIFEKCLAEIWNGKKFDNFRKNQKKVCAGCTLYKWNKNKNPKEFWG